MEKRPKFAHAMAQEFLTGAVQKRRLTKKFIRLGPLLRTSGFLFESNAILGRSFRDRAESFALPFFAKDDTELGDATDFMRSLGRKIAETAPHASTIWQVVIMRAMADQGVQPLSIPLAQTQWLLSRSHERQPLDDALTVGVLFAIRGAGFGMEFPKRLEELYSRSYAKGDPELWNSAFKYGVVDGPEQPEPVPIEEREQAHRADFAEFCSQFYPELLGPLGLQ